MDKPKVSIIMAVYNGEEFLQDSILSVLNQTYKNFEFVIVNDGSTDNTAKILEEFSKNDSRIKIVNNIENIGLTKSLNRGIRESVGEYIARLDAGDLSTPDRIEREVDFLNKNKDIGLVGSWMQIIDTEGKTVEEVKYPTEDEIIRHDLIGYNPFVHSSIMFRRGVGQKAGFYNEVYKYAQDYNFYFQLLPHTKFSNIPACLVKYRRYPNSITMTKNREQIKFANRARALAIESGLYSKLNYMFVVRSFLISLLPSKIKFFVKKHI